jgi:hypothetical protein
MFIKALIVCVAAVSATLAVAAGQDYPFVDKSSPALMDEATARAVLDEIMTERMARLYSPRAWGFATQVVGGFTPTGTCVVTARVMLLPRNNPRPTRSLLFKPERMAMAFDALPNANVESCRALAKKQLTEAMLAVESGLVR